MTTQGERRGRSWGRRRSGWAVALGALCVLVGALTLRASLEPRGQAHAEASRESAAAAPTTLTTPGGEDVAAPAASAMPRAFASDLEAALEAAARSPYRLHYFPEEIVPSDTVFDLCDDRQAGLAGLDVEGKAGARDAIGVDCVTSRNRFAYKPRGDALHVVDSYAQAQAQLDAIDGARGRDARGILLGSFGATLAMSPAALEPAGAGFAVDAAALHVADGHLRGLLVNTTSQVAHGVRVQVGERRVLHPLSVQPGETVAFAIPVHDERSPAARPRVQARFEAAPDLNRRVLVGGTPGRWSGSLEAFGRIRPDLVGAIDADEVRYFETTLVAVSGGGSERRGEGARGEDPLRHPTVVAAALDADRRVLAVLHPAVVQWGEWNVSVTELPLGEEVSVGFVVPPGTEDVLVSVGAPDRVSEKWD